LQVEKIRAVKEAALKTGVLLVLNARTDVYLKEVGVPESRYDETLRRLIAYRDAGADCVFVPGLRDVETIGRIVRDVKCPVNILGGPGSPAIPELEKLGVARVTVGSSAMRATLELVRRIGDELKSSGTYGSLEGGIAYGDVNKMLERR
jgi:2-methylisocitrate lyase-like PEP mutase family enzyme